MPHGDGYYTFYQKWWEPMAGQFIGEFNKESVNESTNKSANESAKDGKCDKCFVYSIQAAAVLFIVSIIGSGVINYMSTSDNVPKQSTTNDVPIQSTSFYVPVDNGIISGLVYGYCNANGPDDPYCGTLITPYYAPGDTHIIPDFNFISILCDGLIMTVSGDTGATLYLLKDKPSLSGPVNNLTATPPTTIKPKPFHYLEYHLHAGSKLNMTYCLDEPSSSSAVSFFLIKGHGNWGWFTDDPLHLYSSVRNVSLRIDNPCTGGNKTLLYNFNSTDEYYFVFESGTETDVKLKASLFLQRTQYNLTNISIADSCSIGSVDKCRVFAPFWSDYTILISVNDGPIAEENLDIKCSCDLREWIVFLMFVILFSIIVAALYLLRKLEMATPWLILKIQEHPKLHWLCWLLSKIVPHDDRLYINEYMNTPRNSLFRDSPYKHTPGVSPRNIPDATHSFSYSAYKHTPGVTSINELGPIPLNNLPDANVPSSTLRQRNNDNIADLLM